MKSIKMLALPTFIIIIIKWLKKNNKSLNESWSFHDPSNNIFLFQLI